MTLAAFFNSLHPFAFDTPKLSLSCVKWRAQKMYCSAWVHPERVIAVCFQALVSVPTPPGRHNTVWAFCHAQHMVTSPRAPSVTHKRPWYLTSLQAMLREVTRTSSVAWRQASVYGGRCAIGKMTLKGVSTAQNFFFWLWWKWEDSLSHRRQRARFCPTKKELYF